MHRIIIKTEYYNYQFTKMKTKNSLASRVLMCIVAVVMTMMTLTSCSEFDNSIVYGPDIVGWWYTEYNQKGAYGDE